MNDTYVWICVAIIAFVTAALRFLPFIIFSDKRKTPSFIERLGAVLPYAIMGMLVVYCLKDVDATSASGVVPPIIASAVVGVSYVIKRNTLISIILGTVCYMVMVQLVF